MDPTLVRDNDESVSGAVSNFEETPNTEVALTPLYDADVAALTHADAGAAAEADADRAALLDEQGADANASEQKVDLIRKRLADGT